MVEGDNVCGRCLKDPPSVSGLLKRLLPKFQDLGSIHEPKFARFFVFYSDDGVSLFPCVLKVINKQVWVTGDVPLCLLLSGMLPWPRFFVFAGIFMGGMRSLLIPVSWSKR